LLLLVEDFWEANWPVHLATEVVSKDHNIIVLNTVLSAKFSLYQMRDNPVWQHLLLHTMSKKLLCTCSVYSVIKIALKSRTSSGPSLRAGAGSNYEHDPRLLLYETKGKSNQKNFLALQFPSY